MEETEEYKDLTPEEIKVIESEIQMAIAGCEYCHQSELVAHVEHHEDDSVLKKGFYVVITKANDKKTLYRSRCFVAERDADNLMGALMMLDLVSYEFMDEFKKHAPDVN